MKRIYLFFVALSLSTMSLAASPKVGDSAPAFVTKTHEGKNFDLNERKGKWTVLYFYPKAETPGCTTQACAFRDAIHVIRDMGAEVYGLSADGVETLKSFHEHHKLNFVLLSDSGSSIIKQYGTKMPVLGYSKRHTFIVDPSLVIRYINTEVDPAKDPQVVADKIKELKSAKN